MSETETEAESVLDHFWPDHLSGQEVKTKWPRGRNATIESVGIEDIFHKDINEHKPKVVVVFEGIGRGLVCNKTNGRWLAEQFGGDADKWVGKVVSLMAANRSNGTIGVDIDKPFESEK